jgi:hypothetical protein
MAVKRGPDGQRRDGEGNLVNGIQPHMSTRRGFRMCGVMDADPLDGSPKRRHRVAENAVWSRGMAMLPLDQHPVGSRRLRAIPPRSQAQRRPRVRVTRRRRTSRRFTSSSPPGDSDEPEPSGLVPQAGRQQTAGKASLR